MGHLKYWLTSNGLAASFNKSVVFLFYYYCNVWCNFRCLNYWKSNLCAVRKWLLYYRRIYRSWALRYFLNPVLRRHCFSEYSYVKCLRCCGSYYMFGETATLRSSFLYKYQCLIFCHKSIESFILSWKYYTSLYVYDVYSTPIFWLLQRTFYDW